MTEGSLLVSTVLATCALAAGYASSGLGVWALLLGLLGLLWLFGQRRGWRWTASAALTLHMAAAAGGIWMGLGTGLMLGGAVAALSAWDLDHFAHRLRAVARDDGTHELEKRHLRRLLVVDGLGALFAGAALGMRIEFGFVTAFLLGLLGIFGLSRMIGALTRESE